MSRTFSTDSLELEWKHGMGKSIHEAFRIDRLIASFLFTHNAIHSQCCRGYINTGLDNSKQVSTSSYFLSYYWTPIVLINHILTMFKSASGGKGNYEKSGRQRYLHEKKIQESNARFMEQMLNEVQEDINDSSRRRLGGGKSCGQSGDYIFEFAINGKIVASWNKENFCKHYTRTGYNLDLIKFMDDESMKGDFELAMRMRADNGNEKAVMGIGHLYWA